ncbi:MarR family transcriptional regulator [Paraburkholderia eburnea]|uniref:MarR family transcriptional regulator n=2 Tax=Paraburkholderia eburnea TaxID=1189126 RepID=A0A2S4M4T9_9BURK|nr:MarR family transcriptional regulator [Paraburkholderia eburnea]PRZ20164.1 MarR family transcriptional regulator [Paraburkholderia eburnea]
MQRKLPNNQRKTMSEGVYGEQAAGRVTHSLLRLSTAMRSQAWDWAEGAGLTPTQGEILVLLMQRKGPMRLGEIARETALTAATTSDAVSTLETKGLVEKRRALDDGRALAVRLTARGRTAAKKAAQWPDFLSKAVGTLRADEQSAFYRTLLKTVYVLESQEAMPQHRMCLSCSHFEPSKTPKKTPHKCALLGIQMADTDLRLDCSVYEQADATTQKKNWKIFAA